MLWNGGGAIFCSWPSQYLTEEIQNLANLLFYSRKRAQINPYPSERYQIITYPAISQQKVFGNIGIFCEHRNLPHLFSPTKDQHQQIKQCRIFSQKKHYRILLLRNISVSDCSNKNQRNNRIVDKR